jgi:hypothetical protein
MHRDQQKIKIFTGHSSTVRFCDAGFFLLQISFAGVFPDYEETHPFTEGPGTKSSPAGNPWIDLRR